MDKSTENALLAGRYQPKPLTLHKLATILGVSEAWLLGYSDIMQPSDKITVSYDKGTGILTIPFISQKFSAGTNILSGDFIIFSRGLISGDGIHVIVLCNEVMVKRLPFDAPADTLTIISENSKHPAKTVNAENVRILGKVVGRIHSEPA